jgi:hypothetical protein
MLGVLFYVNYIIEVYSNNGLKPGGMHSRFRVAIEYLSIFL